MFERPCRGPALIAWMTSASVLTQAPDIERLADSVAEEMLAWQRDMHQLQPSPAVLNTASSRTAAVQPPSRLPEARTPARQRSKGDTDTPIPRETTSMFALPGGNSRAAALSSKTRPQRATCSPPCAPRW